MKQEQTVTIKPKVAVLLDGSESTTIKKGQYSGVETYNPLVAGLSNSPEKLEIDFYKFGSDVKPAETTGFTPDLGATNLYEALENVMTSDINYSSAVLVSDGIITIGKNPVVLSSESEFPVHVIGIGDTSQVKDISIRNITTNSTGFTETRHPVQVDISQFGFPNQVLDVNLSDGAAILESKQIQFTENSEIQQVDFGIELTEPGLKQFTIQVQNIAGEWINENNQSNFSVEVLNSKKRILHISSAIHPDVKTVRSILSGDQNIELYSYDYLGNGRSFKNYESLPDELDLVIIHGEASGELLNTFSASLDNLSSLIFDLPEQSLSPEFNLIQRSSGTSYQMQIEQNPSEQDHPVLNLPEIDLRSSAPLFGDISTNLVDPGATILFNSIFQNISTQNPIVAISEQGNIRKAHISAYGWYKVYLSTNDLERRFVTKFISNISDWTSSNPDNRLLKIKPSKNVFGSGDTPQINAGLINENGEIESSATIEVTISGSDYSADFTMNNKGEGNYQLEIPALPEGNYEFSATARKGNREIDTQTGEFVLTESSNELSNTIRNDDLLSSIAANSNGSFRTFTNVNDFWNQPEITQNLNQTTEIKESYLFPVRSVHWFILVIVLLFSEWMIRKRFSLP